MKQDSLKIRVCGVGGLCAGVLLYLLGGDEKQLLVPLLFLALSSSYSYPLIFQNTAFFFFYCLPASPGSYQELQQLCLRPRSRRTTKRAVTGQLPALVMIPQTFICVFAGPPSPEPFSSGHCSKPSVSFLPTAWPSICLRRRPFYLGATSNCQANSSRCPL